MKRFDRGFRAAACLAVLLAVPSAGAQKAAYSHYLKALLMSNQGNFAQALKEYEAALKLDPQSASMNEQAAETALELGEIDRALELSLRFVELAPKSADAHYLLGNVYWARGELDSAKKEFEKAIEVQPDFPKALYSLGNLLSSRSPEEAKKYLQDYLSRNPDNAAEAEFQLAVIEQRAGRDESAAAHLRASIDIDADNMHAYYALAQLYEVRRDTQAALGVYEEILERDSKNVALLNHVGEIYFLLDDDARALERFSRAKEIMPSNPTTCLWMALLAEQRGDFQAAADSIKESSALNEEAALSLRLSYYLTQANKLKEAVAALETAHKTWPRNEEIAYFLALGYDDLKMADKAIALMKTVLEIRPDHRDARFQLGALLEKKGDIVNTEIQFREILRYYPDDASALNFLGYSLADRNLKLDEAEELIRRAIAISPENGAFADSLGWVNFRQGRIASALVELRRAAELMPGDDTIWAHIAEVYAADGKFEDAWKAWKKSQHFGPGKPEYGKNAEKLERKFSPETLTRLYADHMSQGLGRLERYGGPCAIEGKIAGRTFAFNGIFHYKAPWDISVDVLGPLFVPIFRLGLTGEDGFEMDPLDLGGVSPELLRENMYAAVRLLRDYLEGGMLRGDAVRYRRGWRRSQINSGEDILYLDKTRVRVESVARGGDNGMTLTLGAYRPVGTHRVPSVLSLEGRGFSIRFKLSGLNAVFEGDPAGFGQ